MKYIEKLLTRLEELKPVPSGIKANISKNNKIKAVLFDVYGTLLISASGDDNQSEIFILNLKKALVNSGISITTNSGFTENKILHAILDELKRNIDFSYELLREKKIPFPEIDIIKIWEAVLFISVKKGWIMKTNEFNLRVFILNFELSCNYIYPMPNMKKVVTGLHERKVPIGIISNAQFYTSMFVNYFLTGDFRETDAVDFFDPELTVFSYQSQRAKPDVWLFDKIIQALNAIYSIQPSEVLFVGNDMYTDIFPANSSGFKTALFAGDKRSLRLREDKPELNNLKPDYIITSLEQVFEIIG